MALSFNCKSIIRNGNSLVGNETGVVKKFGPYCTVSNLGAANPNDVVFDASDDFPTSFEEVNINGNIFIKFPKFYRRINTVEDGQITSFTIATDKRDSTYQLYPCFERYSGFTKTGEADCVYIGKYVNSSSTSINSVGGRAYESGIQGARNKARALGPGYQLYDWKLEQLCNDLYLACYKTLNIHNSAIAYLGLPYNMTVTIDGIVFHEFAYYVCYDPSLYTNIDRRTSVTTGYTRVNYTANISTNLPIKKLGYDPSNPFAQMPSETINSSKYDIYYWSLAYAESTDYSHWLGISRVMPESCRGVHAVACWDIWYYNLRHRLCYIPPS